MGIIETIYCGLISLPENIGVLFPPRRVAHFSDNRLDPIGIRCETIEEVERTEVLAEIPQLREQPDRSTGARSCLILHQIANAPINRAVIVAEVVFLAESRHAEPPLRQKRR